MAAQVPVRGIVRFVGAACVFALLLGSGRAWADTCLDASDEARAAMKARHLLEARAKLRLCAATECSADVRALCDERLAEVSERLPTVIFDAKRSDGSDLSEVAVSIDGVPRPDVVMGAEIALDPGPHTVLLRDTVGGVVERRIVAVEREKARRERVSFGQAPAPAPSEPVRVKVEVPVVYAPPRSGVLARDAGLFALGGATVAAIAGVAFGAVAIARNDAAGCDAANMCTSPGARSEARIAATASTVTLVSAFGLAALGVTLLVWPKSPPRPVRLALAPFGAGGSF